MSLCKECNHYKPFSSRYQLRRIKTRCDLEYTRAIRLHYCKDFEPKGVELLV